MASVYLRGRRYWCKYRDASGEIVRRPTKYNEGPGQEELAKRYAKRKEIAAEKRGAGVEPPLTVKRYADAWVKERDERGIRSAKRSERSHLKRQILPLIGQVLLAELTEEHCAMPSAPGAKRGTRRAPSIVFETLRSMLNDARPRGRLSATSAS